MRTFWIGVVVTVTVAMITRTRWGTKIGNEVRYLSDQLMLGFLRVTSEFEREAEKR
ncbi:MAG: hypothetical protein ACKVVP_24905 [Chloroflexota bacterium]